VIAQAEGTVKPTLSAHILALDLVNVSVEVPAPLTVGALAPDTTTLPEKETLLPAVGVALELLVYAPVPAELTAATRTL
jgi:hypothetical protein